MPRSFHAVILIVTLCLLRRNGGVTASCMGCVELDEISFDKMIGHFKYALVKFDIAFPYGPKHEMYGEFAGKFGPKLGDLLVSLVGVKDYGEKENRVLAQRYNVDEKAYPEILLFINGDIENYVKYPREQEISVDNLKRFVIQHTGIYIPLDGCIEEFDRLVGGFVAKSDAEQRAIIERAGGMLDELQGETRDRAEIYVRLMEKTVEKKASADHGGGVTSAAQFIEDEHKRVEKLLKGKLSDNKKKQFTHRYNILQSFRQNGGGGGDNGQETSKDEL